MPFFSRVNSLLTLTSNLRAEQGRIIQDHQRQLQHVQETAKADIERTRKQLETEMADLQKTADSNADRTRKRMEAEIADLQNTIGKLEADLAKVRNFSVKCDYLLIYYRQTRTMFKIFKLPMMNIRLIGLSKLHDCSVQRRKRKSLRRGARRQTKGQPRLKSPWLTKNEKDKLFRVSLMIC